ncbi:MAG: hypothetical protein NTV84_06540, partial [Methanoregula sp.]|nr:hypothetical protein [Methanoregula sp.]
MALVAITFAISAGCTSPTGPTRASPIQATPIQVSQTLAPSTQATATNSQSDFSQVTHAEVSTNLAHWSSGAEYDGIAVHPSLYDVKSQTVTWSGVPLPVDIEIYTTKYDANYKTVKDQLVYKGTGTISNWQDGNMFMGGGIQVPFASMKVPAGKTRGVIYVTVHMPDG